MTLIDSAFIASLVATIAAIPISPGALGLQEGAYVAIMNAYGIPAEDGLLISLFARVQNLTLGLLAGLNILGGILKK